MSRRRRNKQQRQPRQPRIVDLDALVVANAKPAVAPLLVRLLDARATRALVFADPASTDAHKRYANEVVAAAQGAYDDAVSRSHG